MSRQIEISDTAAVLIFDEGDLPDAFELVIPEGEDDDVVPLHAHIAAALFRWIPFHMEEVSVIMAEYFQELEEFTNGGEDEGTEGQEEESD